jgi:hypothetical protein
MDLLGSGFLGAMEWILAGFAGDSRSCGRRVLRTCGEQTAGPAHRRPQVLR